LLAYLVRRLLENGANSSFVHQLADEDVSEEELLADPVEKVMAVGGTRHPAIRLPVNLFAPERANSAGLDLEDARILAETSTAITVKPVIPKVDSASVDRAISAAVSAFPGWSITLVEKRAACLDKLADLLEQHRGALMAIAVQEARKTIPDALSEVREAVDFCRYYAARAREDLLPQELPGPTGERNVLRMEARGVWAAIAPWNFPWAGGRSIGHRQHGGCKARAADA
jgi:RHH-type transcriptional regulator, proline utilization regulon repressor / proline dehydrogenase / delta 1-pyrroline-5-carboxylate dehydrogenase